MGIKKESTEARKEQITRAAISIIGKEGIKSFTTARVAREVGISEANLYRHFKNKEAILLSVVDDVEENLFGNIAKVRSENMPAIEKMESVFKLHLRYIQENSGVPRIVFSSEMLFVRGLQKKLLAFVNAYLKKLGEIIEEGIKDGSIKEDASPEALSTILVGMIQFNALRWMLGGFKQSLAGKSEKLWESYRKNLVRKKGR